MGLWQSRELKPRKDITIKERIIITGFTNKYAVTCDYCDRESYGMHLYISESRFDDHETLDDKKTDDPDFFPICDRCYKKCQQVFDDFKKKTKDYDSDSDF